MNALPEMTEKERAAFTSFQMTGTQLADLTREKEIVSQMNAPLPDQVDLSEK